MRKIGKFIGVFFFCLLALLFPPAVGAVGEFQVDYEVQYAVAPTGVTIVTQDVVLTNKQTNLYPKQYSIVIDSEKIRNVIAYDGKGVISPEIRQKDGKTELFLTFNEQVVGLGKQLKFSLRYENNEIAQKIGTVWEINIPGVAADTDLASYNVTLNVPPSFGAVAYLSPAPTLGRSWTKDQMVKGGISAAYGEEQVFSVKLSYFLENPDSTRLKAEIALPPDTAFQKVIIQTLEPSPITVTRDGDGNWLAQYELDPKQKLEITANLSVAIHLTPRENFVYEDIETGKYTAALRFWESDNEEIRKLATQYKTPREIYDYVVKSLTYDYERVNQNPVRQGAVAALASPKNSICMEFTDLFIAIARAAGIPARENVGYAYTTNARLRPLSLVSDVLHAWPEYWDETRKLWVPIDPTWANTTGGVNYFDKLDFNHIVFAIHGEASDYPYPAGFYRQAGKIGKDVEVKFVDVVPKSLPGKLDVQYFLPKKVSAGFPVKGTIQVVNTSGESVPEATIAVSAAPFGFSLNRTERNIPPFTTIFLPINFNTGNFFAAQKAVILVSVNGNNSSYYFEVAPLYWLLVPISIALGIVAASSWYFGRRAKVWVSSKKH